MCIFIIQWRHITYTSPTCTNTDGVLPRLSPEECTHVEAQLDELTATYNQLCDSSTQQLQQLEQQLASEEEKKVYFLKDMLRCDKGPANISQYFMLLMKTSFEFSVNLLFTRPPSRVCVWACSCVLCSMCTFFNNHCHYWQVNNHLQPFSDMYSNQVKMETGIHLFELNLCHLRRIQFEYAEVLYLNLFICLKKQKPRKGVPGNSVYLGKNGLVHFNTPKKKV